MTRNSNLTNDLIFVDGFWGSGKSSISPIVSSYKNVEIPKIKPIFEYLPALVLMEKCDREFTIKVLNLFTDTYSYNSLISRETNFRYKDFTSALKRRQYLKYFIRLFKKDGDKIIDEINNDNIAMHFVTHMMYSSYPLLKETYKERLKFIEIIRHPLYLIKHWNTYLTKHWEKPREFTLSFDYMGVKIPWFAYKWSAEYIQYNEFEKTVFILIKIYSSLFALVDSNLNDKNSFKIISFEKLIFDTNETITELTNFLNRNPENFIQKILKEQKLPRTKINDAVSGSYGWQKKDTEIKEIENYNNLKNTVLQNCNESLYNRFIEIVLEYENRWPIIKSKLYE